MSNAKSVKDTSKDAVKNPAVNADTLAGAPDTTDWDEEAIGFAPYWNPTEGAEVVAAVIAHDTSGSEQKDGFNRFVLTLLQNELACKRGPAEDAEEVIVRKGEQFTISEYVQLTAKFIHFAQCADHGVLVPMKLTAKEKVKGGKGNVWIFGLKLPKESKAKMAELVAKRSMSGIGGGNVAGALPQAQAEA